MFSITLQFRFDNFGFYVIQKTYFYKKLFWKMKHFYLSFITTGICYVTKQFGERAAIV
jgi:hypothetical protein